MREIWYSKKHVLITASLISKLQLSPLICRYIHTLLLSLNIQQASSEFSFIRHISYHSVRTLNRTIWYPGSPLPLSAHEHEKMFLRLPIISTLKIYSNVPVQRGYHITLPHNAIVVSMICTSPQIYLEYARTQGNTCILKRRVRNSIST